MGSRHRNRIAVALFCAVALAACGTRLPDEAFVQSGTVLDEAGTSAGGAVRSGPVGSATTTPGGPSTGDAAAGPTGEGGGAAAEPGADGGAAPEAGGPSGPAGGAAAGPNQASDVGVTETTVKVGTIVAESGVLGDAFAPAARGIRAWVGEVNANGGLHGREVELVTCDDREDRSRSLACARRLVEQDQVFALVATNTRALGGAAPYLAEQGVPVFGIPITNAFYRWNNFFSAYGAPYPRDGQTAGHQNQLRSMSGHYRWFRENLQVRRAAVVAYDVKESAQAGEFIAKGLQLEGYEVDRYTVSFAAPSFDQVVADMQRKGTEIVFDSMDDGANRRFCDTLARRGYQVKAKVSTIVAMGQSLGQDFNETCRNVTYITLSSAPYSQTGIPAIAAFRAAFSRYQPGTELHQWALEAYLLGRMFGDAMEEMGPTPTRKAIIDKFNGWSDKVVIEGALVSWPNQPVDYDAERGEHCFAIARWQDSANGWTEATRGFPFCYPDAIQYFTPVSERGD